MEREINLYTDALKHWLPGARLVTPATLHGLDAIIRWTRGDTTIHFAAELKRHLGTQDVRLVAAQLERWLTAPNGRVRRGLLLAPYVRRQQAVELQDRGIDYLDLAGNAHLEAPGVFVHVEGKRPAKDALPPEGRLTKGWTKTVMALLVRPELVAGPYRPIAEVADVALGTVTVCMNDLKRRGFLQEAKGQRVLVKVPDLVALWIPTYGDVLRPKLRVRHFQMRETEMRRRWEVLGRVLVARGIRWALTGADGAAVRKDFFRAAETEIYANPHQLEGRDILEELVAQPAAHRGNLLVIEPPAPLALPLVPIDTPHPPTAPPLLIYAELRLRGTDQANEAAEMLLPELMVRGDH